MDNPNGCADEGECRKDSSSFLQWVHSAFCIVQGTTILTAVDLEQVLWLSQQLVKHII
ncbi:hypothetical protein [Nostoc sp. FACHB-145]|uniref:hypothetical protein n=1 Tax=Nostoc sp. FACHB-145 TaxID=2692836 RepID=UPI0016887C68|nr:hypothetical protein [Nostoc sp. FACHB-145]